MDQTTKREGVVLLPPLYESWPKLKGDLNALAAKDIQGISSFEEVLEKNDRWKNVHLPCNLLRGVLKDGIHFSTEHFCDTLLPWVAQKALDVEKLFKESEYKLKVRKDTSEPVLSLIGRSLTYLEGR